MLLSSDGVALFFRISTKELVRIIMSHSDSINDLVIQDKGRYVDKSGDDLIVITGSKDKTIRIWSLLDNSSGEGKPKDALDIDLKMIEYFESGESKNGDIKALAWCKEKQQLASGDMEGNVRIFQLDAEDPEVFKVVSTFPAHEDKVQALSYSKPYRINPVKGRSEVEFLYLLSASSDKLMHVYNANSDSYDVIQTIDTHKTQIVGASFARIRAKVGKGAA